MAVLRIDVGEVWPVLLCAMVAVGIAATPLLAKADPPVGDTPRRIATLDGLRGFLALAVFLHHGAIYRSYLRTDAWVSGSDFNTMLGQSGVAMFFMLTGFLFWGRLVRRGGALDWVGFYVGRVFRIGPIYLLAATGALVATVALTRQLNVGFGTLAEQAGQWLLLGAVPAASVNGYDTPLLLAGVTWSLNYEWLFYASLPVLALLARSPRTHLPLAGTVLGASLTVLLFDPAPLPGSPAAYVGLFAVGMVCASLQALGIVPRWRGAASSWLALLLFGAALAGFSSAYQPGAILCLGALFYLVASGCSLFGLLHTRAAHRLGNISYDLYLLQGLVLAALLRPAPMRALSLGSPEVHWLLIGVATLLLLLVATAAHAWLERPGMRMGETVARWLATRPLGASLRADEKLLPEFGRERPS